MTNEQLLEIIKKALKNEKYSQKAIKEEEILIQADTNGLLPLLFSGITKDVFTNKNYEKLKKRVFASVYNDNSQKMIIKRVNDIFNDNKIDHIFLKGTHLKEIYSESYFRSMGDIDVIIRKDKIDTSRVLFKEKGFKNYGRTAEHDVYLSGDYFVEVHRDIYARVNNKDKNSLLRPWDFAVKDEKHRYRLDYAFEGVYLVHHLRKHVLSSGIGLRSILDISVFFNHYEKEINKELLIELLEENKLNTFFQTILYINKKAFDVDSSFKNKSFNLDNKDYQEILNYISGSGTHGKAGNINLMAPRVAKKGKLKTFFRLFFPTWAYMKENYPWLKYLPFLLPVAYLIRGFQFLLFKTKYTFKKIKNVQKSNQEAEDLHQTFKKMGL